MTGRELRLIQRALEMLDLGDAKRAAAILESMAEPDDVAALTLARIYEMGHSNVDKDLEYAIAQYEWITKGQVTAANEALEEAHLALGRIFIEHFKFDPDHSRALSHFNFLARNNVPAGMFGLGLLNQFGLGVPKDEDLATRHFQAASTLGHIGAKMQLLAIQGGLASFLRRVLLAVRINFLKRKEENLKLIQFG